MRGSFFSISLFWSVCVCACECECVCVHMRMCVCVCFSSSWGWWTLEWGIGHLRSSECVSVCVCMCVTCVSVCVHPLGRLGCCPTFPHSHVRARPSDGGLKTRCHMSIFGRRVAPAASAHRPPLLHLLSKKNKKKKRHRAIDDNEEGHFN